MNDTDLVAIRLLKQDPLNPRHMPDLEMAAPGRSIAEFDMVEPMVVRSDCLVIDGHQRIAATR